jgi:carboxymethylenebutenolidase
MGEMIRLVSADGFTFDAYEAKPEGDPRGGVVVVQEIFGVNSHIREVCDGYAADGYHAVAPAIFDRVEADVELGYDEAGMTKGVELARGKLDMNDTLADVQAAVDYLAGKGKVGIVGYCFGGLICWLAAAKLESLHCASGYYGGGIAQANDLQPNIPVILHFGELDAHIPMTDVRAIEDAHPDVTVHVYPADHGFNCDHRASYDESAAQLARERTLALFARYLA